jgi:hypothetical protein
MEEDGMLMCGVCSDGGWTDSNLIVLCDGDNCDVAVHQECYGIHVIPQGDDPWYCERCTHTQKKPNKSGKTRCLLCAEEGGPMKRVGKLQWVHVLCVYAFPCTEFRDLINLSGIRGHNCSQMKELQLQKNVRVVICCIQASCDNGMYAFLSDLLLLQEPERLCIAVWSQRV